MKQRTHLDVNVSAVDLDVTTEEVARLDATFPVGAAASDRYNPEHARRLGQ